MGHVVYNPNPEGRHVGDCTVRAIAKATGQDWDTVYTGLCAEGYAMKDMPSSNAVWGAYLRQHGYCRNVIPDSCPDDYSVSDFCQDHPSGTYLLAISGHLVCVEAGDYWDAWDSGREVSLFFWTRKGD